MDKHDFLYHICDLPRDKVTFRPDGLVDVDGTLHIVRVGHFSIPVLPVQFGEVSGDVILDDIGLTTLKGVPKTVHKNFSVSNNKLLSLEHAPTICRGNFWCDGNQLTTLKGAPFYIYGNFLCDHNELTTLEGGPKIVENNFSCEYNELTNFIGGPNEIGGRFVAYNNPLTSTEGAPKHIGNGLYLSSNMAEHIRYGTFFYPIMCAKRCK